MGSNRPTCTLHERSMTFNPLAKPRHDYRWWLRGSAADWPGLVGSPITRGSRPRIATRPSLAPLSGQPGSRTQTTFTWSQRRSTSPIHGAQYNAPRRSSHPGDLCCWPSEENPHHRIIAHGQELAFASMGQIIHHRIAEYRGYHSWATKHRCSYLPARPRWGLEGGTGSRIGQPCPALRRSTT